MPDFCRLGRKRPSPQKEVPLTTGARSPRPIYRGAPLREPLRRLEANSFRKTCYSPTCSSMALTTSPTVFMSSLISIWMPNSSSKLIIRSTVSRLSSSSSSKVESSDLAWIALFILCQNVDYFLQYHNCFLLNFFVLAQSINLIQCWIVLPL